jgi:hypothetical protein
MVDWWWNKYTYWAALILAFMTAMQQWYLPFTIPLQGI